MNQSLIPGLSLGLKLTTYKKNGKQNQSPMARLTQLTST